MNWLAKVALVLVALAAPAPTLPAATVEVSSLEQLGRAIDEAAPGDRIVVADGRYTSTGAVTIARAGTPQKPIVVEAKTVGGVEVRGEAGFLLERPAAYVVIRGFVFTHKAGSMRIGEGVHHCRVTRNLFELQVTGRATYLSVFGDDNEIDHNTFRNKGTEGQMVYVQGPGEDAMARRTWVHHNYFLDFKSSRRNNSTGLHVGSSYRSMSPAYSVAEYNLFVRNVGENEGAVCNKSCDNVYRYNTIVDSTELSLRHGHRCQVYGNFMINSGGLRFFGHDHVIYSNYFERCRPALSIGNGGATIPPGSLQSHQRPDRVKVAYNTLVNNRSNVVMLSRRGGLGSDELAFANNIILGGGKAVSLGGPLKDPRWEGNIVWGAEGGAGDIPADGFTAIDPGLAKDDRGVFRLAAGSPAIGKGAGSYPFVTVDLDGQPRPGKRDVGADQFSREAPVNRPLTEADVGPDAPEEVGRSLISAPKAEWLPREPAG